MFGSSNHLFTIGHGPVSSKFHDSYKPIHMNYICIYCAYVVRILFFNLLVAQMGSGLGVWTKRISTPWAVFPNTIVTYKY